jgi:hypothetical protein
MKMGVPNFGLVEDSVKIIAKRVLWLVKNHIRPPKR